MLKKLKLSLLASMAFAFVAVPVLAVGSVSAADVGSNLCKGADLSFSGSEDCTQDGANTEDKLNSLITDIVNIFSVVVGIVAVIMIIIGGFKYITSGGDSGNVTGAKNTILYAIIGLVVVALAQFVVKFVLTKANETV